MFNFFYFITIFLISLILFKIFIPIYNNNIIDVPNLRSSHNIAKPTGGGLIFALITSLLDLFRNEYLSTICLPLSILGFLDDKKNISSFLRFFSQFLTVLVLIFITNDHSNLIKILIENHIIILLLPLTIFFTGIINFTNFMDGIDGLVGGSMLVIFLFFSINNNYLLFSIIPSLFAFLFFNWHPSKIFMGDSGSNFLGSIYVAMLLKCPSLMDSLILLTLSAPLFLDSLTCLVRRFFSKQNIFKPHKLHLYQRLVQAGFSHNCVSIMYISATFLLTCIATKSDINLIVYAIVIIFCFGFLLDKKFALSYEKALLNGNVKKS